MQKTLALPFIALNVSERTFVALYGEIHEDLLELAKYVRKMYVTGRRAQGCKRVHNCLHSFLFSVKIVNLNYNMTVNLARNLSSFALIIKTLFFCLTHVGLFLLKQNVPFILR